MFHLEHHRYTRDPERDPELAQPEAADWNTYLWRVSGLPYWFAGCRTFDVHAKFGRVLVLVAASVSGTTAFASLFDGRARRLSDMLRNSGTTQSNALIRWLAWNMPYHAEHHRYAVIPFHALPEAHAFLKHHIAVQSRGYWDVHRALTHSLGR